ncbi:hypothetical protein [Duganella violaceipulchra]|uniref:HIRAN domain-containing protein n=1 Tax=Duganella violaceipulchra TaxID=2849652 RepID=A0AA41HCA1_9BURK|nr:hypothetical protein [Duganella violaceicalia]MBV6323926.1 hypothetical protein [Duganella violaceicalia]MCP2011094.1 hypothetical protein [Duganella violaceicalia]
MELAISLLIIAVTGLVVYAIIKTNPAKPMPLPERPATPYEPKLPDVAPALHWSDDGRFLVEVVNESRYQATLKALAGDHGDQAAATPYLATLVPDDVNPYESAAVAVFLNGRMTGYLSPKASLTFRALLKHKEIEGQVTSCDAQVRGGGVWQSGHLAYVVVLDIEQLEK